MTDLFTALVPICFAYASGYIATAFWLESDDSQFKKVLLVFLFSIGYIRLVFLRG